MPYDENGEWVDENYDYSPSVASDAQDPGTPQYNIPSGDNADDHGEIKQPAAPAPSGGGVPDQSDSVRKDMMNKLGGLYTEGAYEEARHHDFDPNWISRIEAKESLRANNEPGSEYHDNGKGGYLTKPVAKTSALLGGFNPQGSGGSGGSSSSSSGGNSKSDDIYGVLKGLFPGGAFNQDVVNRRLDSVRSGLNAARTQATRNNEAYLADRGLVGSGPQASANENLESRLFGQFGSAYNDIYATEAENADKRMVQALQLATGMTEQEAQNQIDWFRAQTENELGHGNLAARNREADISRELGLGNIDIGRMNAGTNSYKAQTDYDIATKQLEQARRDYDEAVRTHDMEAADRAQGRINELEQIRAAGTHK
jgi:hypothetical protein